MDNSALESRIGYRFQRPELLQQALTHRSHSAPHNERLEFLGDGVLNCIVADELYCNFSTLKEGDLSRLRAHLVRQESLHLVAQNLGLGDFLQLGEGEIKSGGFNRPSILADTLEALVGAAFLDGGFEGAQQFPDRKAVTAIRRVRRFGAGPRPSIRIDGRQGRCTGTGLR